MCDLARTLERELTALTAERDLLRAEVAEMHQTFAGNVHTDNRQLRAEVERCNDIINRASTQFFHNGTDGETAAKMLTVLNEAKPCELCGGLALGQENCDAAYDELRVDCDELRDDVVRLTARAERAEADLATERARLDWLRDNVEEIYSKDQHGIVYLSGDNIRAAIDAAMQEDAK
jgi:N-acetylglutamate synthase/N-acetylornithine aminotransferase